MKHLLLLLTIALISCNNKKSVINKYLNENNLTAQELTINIKKDTTVILQSGTRIIVPAGSLKTPDGQPAKLIAKEALTIEDIMLAGLSTESNGVPLRSGGMLYLNAAPGENVEIIEPLGAEIPTSMADTSMQLYKGEVTEDGSINWKDPQPLQTKENPLLANGELLYKKNCASCHHPTKPGTGPALFGAGKRIGNMQTLYNWVNNPAKVMVSSCYFQDLRFKHGSGMMPAFPLLTTEEIDDIFRYINKEGIKRNNNEEYDLPPDYFNYDNCAYYLEAYRILSGQKDSLTAIKEKFIQLEQTYPDSTSVNYRPPIEKIPSESIVSPHDYDADFYVIKIETFGWYNVDIPLGFPETDSELAVSIAGTHAGKNEVFLIIPHSRTFQRGGLLDDHIHWGFYEKNGSIGLEQGKTAYVFAIGENPDKAQLYFGSEKFTTSRSQNIKIKMKPVTRKQLEHAIKKFSFEDITLEANRTYTKETLKSVESKLLNMEYTVHRCSCMQSDTAMSEK